MEPNSPEGSDPADSRWHSLKSGTPAALGADDVPQSSVLRSLRAKTNAKLGVQLPEAPGEPESTVNVSPESTPLRDVAGRYQVLGEIGRGGVGVVFKGHDVDLGRDVALKVLREEFAQNPEVLARFVEEAQIGGQLQHPGIVPVYEIGLQNGERPFFAMKLVKGETLAEQLARRADPSEDRRRLLGIFEQVCQTLAYAHARRVVHRDLKPGNVMIGAFGEVQVVDWGFAKVLPKPGEPADKPAQRAVEPAQVSVISTVRSQQSASSHSVAGSMMGTPAYMPVEQALGDVEHMDQRSDVFGLGAILCEILTGRAVYQVDDGDLIQQAARGDVSKAHARIEKCGADSSLIALCKQCLSPSRLARPASASEVAEQVGAYLTSVEERAREAQIHEAEAKVKARSTLMLAAAALVIVVLGGGGYAWVQNAAAARREKASQRVAEAMNEASGLVGQARVGGLQDLALWDRAVSASEQAERLAHGEDVDDEQRTHVAAQLAVAREERSAAQRSVARAARDALMLHRLVEVRIPTDDNLAGAYYPMKEARRLDAAYAECFRDYLGGQDLLTLGLDVAATALGEGDIEIEMAAGLDHWAIERKMLGQESDAPSATATQALQQLAQRIDHEDTWRNDLRAQLAQPASDRSALEALAKSAAFDSLPATSVVLLGNALWNAGSTDSAIEVYRHGRTTYPADLDLNLLLGVRYESLGDPGWADAITCYRIAVALQPNLVVAWFRLAFVLGDQRHLDEAIASYRKAIEIDPKYAAAHSYLGWALQAQGHFEEAIASSRKAIELDAQYAWAHSNLGWALQAQGHLDEAVASYRKALELDPKYAQAHSYLGWALQAQGHLDEAIASYRKAIELDPKYAWAHSYLGGALQAQGHLDEAIASYRKAVELEPKYAWVHSSLGSALRAQGHLDEAIASYRKAIELDPKNVNAYTTLGRALGAKDDMDGAIVAFRQAIELDPKLAMAHDNLGLALRSQGHLDEALASYRKAIEVDPKHVKAYTYLGDGLGAKGDIEGAIAAYRKAVDLDPKCIPAYLGLGARLNDNKGDHDGAIAAFRKVIELDPTLASVQSYLGIALQGKGDLDGAIAAWRKATEIDSTDAEASNSLAWLLATCADPARRDGAEAVRLAQRAVELAPDASNFNTLGAALCCVEEWSKAIEALDHSIQLNRDEDESGQHVNAYNHCFLAIAHAHLGELDKARADFALAKAWHEAHPKDVNAAETARFLDEARAVIEAGAKR